MKIILVQEGQPDIEVQKEELDETIQFVLTDVEQIVMKNEEISLERAIVRVHLSENKCNRVEILQQAMTTEEMIEKNEVQFSKVDFQAIREKMKIKHLEWMEEMENQFKSSLAYIDHLEEKQGELGERMNEEMESVFKEAKDILGM